MRRGGVLAALAVCACACVFGASATAVATQQDVNPFGFWQKTLGNGKFLEEIMEAKETLTKQLEATKHTMEELAMAQMHEMLEKIESGELSVDGEYEVTFEDEVNGTAVHEGRKLGELMPMWTPSPNPIKQGIEGLPGNIFGDDLANAFTAKADFSGCKLFGGQEICLPAKRYFIRKSVGFACDLQIKKSKSSPIPRFACGNPGVSTALCLEWPIEIKAGAFVVPVTIPICLPDARSVEAILNVLGGNLNAVLNIFI